MGVGGGQEKGKPVISKLIVIASNLTKGAGCFELIPDRRYALMKTARHSHWWELYDLQVGRRLTAFKTMETHAGSLDSYTLPAAILIDLCRLSASVYKDEGVGSTVIRTSGSIAGGWIGGYLGAQGGYKAGEMFGALIGPTQEGFCAVLFGYLGGIVGAQYGDRLARALLEGE